MVISHGYETSTSGLRTLGVEEYSQLDHKGVPGDARNRPAINKGREARELRMAALHLGTSQPFKDKMKIQEGCLKMRMNTQAKPSKIRGGSLRHYNSARDTPLRNLVHDHGVEDRQHHLGDVEVLSVPHSHAKVETRTEDEVILREGPRTLGRGGRVPQSRSHRWAWPRARNLSIFELVVNRQQPRFNDVPSQLMISPISLLMSLSSTVSLITMA
ncbi:hypothetical protein Cgig2_022593 [Carnegiea gigantea]|uniref:Uncharacterized protein n=1 Tax=Carnegiea gigantea TaxID=171969 RepID=A0A9Q1KKL1_9CARY|nr:hypothetical protein Cgig2_022593 [Carnegiea gigantea]